MRVLWSARRCSTNLGLVVQRGVNPTSLFSKQVWQRYIVKDKTVPAGYRLI